LKNLFGWYAVLCDYKEQQSWTNGDSEDRNIWWHCRILNVWCHHIRVCTDENASNEKWDIVGIAFIKMHLNFSCQKYDWNLTFLQFTQEMGIQTSEWTSDWLGMTCLPTNTCVLGSWLTYALDTS
jgi:hypothetical protein